MMECTYTDATLFGIVKSEKHKTKLPKKAK
nr:MAG TPA: hypothetical protein [Caudoviricetes sp.]DAY00934.1 MAG TPA: hypothetical protein [Caudoviricetes sp.]